MPNSGFRNKTAPHTSPASHLVIIFASRRWLRGPGRISMPYRLSPFLVLLLCLSACSDSHWHPDPASSDAKTLKIAVFGSTAGNDQNYSASHEGAELATNSKEFIAIKNSVTIDQLNDAESVDKAIEEARRIRDDPDVLAVVGHS